MSGERLSIGYVAGVHGIRGGLKVTLFDVESEALAAGRELVLMRGDSGEQSQEVGRLRVAEVSAIPGQAGRFRVTMEGLRDRDGAEAFKGCSIEVDRDALPPLGDDEYYLADAVGLAVHRLCPDGSVQELGRVTGLMNNGAQDLFEVEYISNAGRSLQWLLPVLPGFVLEVDAKRVLADVPLGMLPEELEN